MQYRPIIRIIVFQVSEQILTLIRLRRLLLAQPLQQLLVTIGYDSVADLSQLIRSQRDDIGHLFGGNVVDQLPDSVGEGEDGV